MKMDRRGSLWIAISGGKQKKKENSLMEKLKGKNRFRAAVRLVIEYKKWINLDSVEENFEFRKTNKKKQEKRELTLKDRSILLIEPRQRTKENRGHIRQLIKNLGAFKRYEENHRELLAPVCRYQYVPANRVIIRQGHKAEALYFIVNGEVYLSKIEFDEITGESKKIEVGILQPGDVFGEIALLHKIPRTMTIVSKDTVELLYIPVKFFNQILKTSLLEEWDILRDAMMNFNYFKGWNENTIRECCILSQVKNYQPNEIIIGDGKGMVNYVHFLLSGQCQLIEHLHVQIKKTKNSVQYKIFNPEIKESISQKQLNNTKRKHESFDDDVESVDYKSRKSLIDYKELLKNKTTQSIDRMSIVTATLQDVVTQWHGISEIAAMLMKKPSTISQQQYPPGVETIFMQICLLYRGACFALGEELRNRRIVATTNVRCLLIPRYWLLEKNRANIWERVKLFMNSKYPSNNELFQKFVTHRQWKKFQTEFVNDIVKKSGRQIWNDTKKNHVPYSIRINEVPHI